MMADDNLSIIEIAQFHLKSRGTVYNNKIILACHRVIRIRIHRIAMISNLKQYEIS
jgi:hypothetical protein